jgi:hypothetical protein
MSSNVYKNILILTIEILDIIPLKKDYVGTGLTKDSTEILITKVNNLLNFLERKDLFTPDVIPFITTYGTSIKLKINRLEQKINQLEEIYYESAEKSSELQDFNNYVTMKYSIKHEVAITEDFLLSQLLSLIETIKRHEITETLDFD